MDSIWKKGYNEGMPRGKGSTNQLKYFIIIVESFHILILKKKFFFGQIHEKNKLQPILKNGPPKMWIYIKFEALIPHVKGTLIVSYKCNMMISSSYDKWWATFLEIALDSLTVEAQVLQIWSI